MIIILYHECVNFSSELFKRGTEPTNFFKIVLLINATVLFFILL